MARLARVIPLIALLGACSPVREAAPTPAAVNPPPPPRVETLTPPAAPVHPAESARITRNECSGVVFEGLAFDARQQKLTIIDQAGGPGSMFANAESAGKSCGALAAINAGFFTPEGDPLGLVIASGKRAGSWNSASSLGSGIWHENSSGQSAITRREPLGRSGTSSIRELLQAGPMLIENGRLVSGLNSEKSSIRTLILWDGGSRWWLGRSSACTLAQLASATATCKPASWPVRHALNLDGGRSSDLWVSGKIPSGPLTRRTPWNRPVRNFFVLLPR